MSTKKKKKPCTYTLSEGAKQLLCKLATANNRSYSSMLETLIKNAAKTEGLIP